LAREVSRIGQLEDRYWRRFRRPNDDNEPALARLLSRREVALSLAKQRSEVVCLLTEPAAGAA